MKTNETLLNYLQDFTIYIQQSSELTFFEKNNLRSLHSVYKNDKW